MRLAYLIAIAILLSSFAYSAPVIKAVNTGNWDATGTWDLNRAPMAGDTIVIDSKVTVSVVKDITINGVVYLKVYGGLRFTNYATILSFPLNSTVVVYDGGSITGTSNSQKLRLGTSFVYSGDATVTGPQMVSGTQVAFSALAPLPVKFIGFSVSRKSAETLVQWATSQETNAASYSVEKSQDGTNWNVIGSVAAAGNSTQVTNYTYSDRSFSTKTVFYRVKQIDIDGRFIYTPVKSLVGDAAGLAEIKVAGIQNKVILQFPQEVKGATQVRFVSLNGQVMEQQVINGAVGQVILNTTVKGAFVVLINNQDLQVAKQVLL